MLHSDRHLGTRCYGLMCLGELERVAHDIADFAVELVLRFLRMKDSAPARVFVKSKDY